MSPGLVPKITAEYIVKLWYGVDLELTWINTGRKMLDVWPWDDIMWALKRLPRSDLWTNAHLWMNAQRIKPYPTKISSRPDLSILRISNCNSRHHSVSLWNNTHIWLIVKYQVAFICKHSSPVSVTYSDQEYVYSSRSGVFYRCLLPISTPEWRGRLK